MKAVVAAFNQEKALVGAFSVLRDCEKTGCGTDGALHSTSVPTMAAQRLIKVTCRGGNPSLVSGLRSSRAGLGNPCRIVD